MKTHLYLVRHGETDWNKERRFQGHKDIPLNEKGICQAERLANWLKDHSFGAIYSSDLIRAVKTAEILAVPHGLEVLQRKELRERNMGDWEGIHIEEIEAANPTWRTQIEDELWCHRFGIEPVQRMCQRIIHFLNKLVEKHPGNTLLVVSHGGLINGALYELGQGKFGKMKLKNTSVTQLVHSQDHGWEVIQAGVSDHLSEI